MLFMILAVFFGWLIFRELISSTPKDSVSLGYMGVCLLLAVLSILKPASIWLLERKMTEVVHVLADNKPTKVRCEGVVESIFDRTPMTWAGYTYFDTGDVVFKAGWCKQLKRYLKNPDKADQRVRYSVMLLVHEAMHVRGERDEQLTECQAIQRYYRTARMLGVPEDTAKKHGLLYYTTYFPQHPYYSPKCAPGTSMDEELPDSLWQFLHQA